MCQQKVYCRENQEDHRAASAALNEFSARRGAAAISSGSTHISVLFATPCWSALTCISRSEGVAPRLDRMSVAAGSLSGLAQPARTKFTAESEIPLSEAGETVFRDKPALETRPVVERAG